jgi:hypothetical protein
VLRTASLKYETVSTAYGHVVECECVLPRECVSKPSPFYILVDWSSAFSSFLMDISFEKNFFKLKALALNLSNVHVGSKTAVGWNKLFICSRCSTVGRVPRANLHAWSRQGLKAASVLSTHGSHAQQRINSFSAR